MNNSLFLRIPINKSFSFKTITNKNLNINDLKFFLKNNKTKYTSISKNGIVKFENIENGTYILEEAKNNKYLNNKKYKIEIQNNNILINNKNINNFKIIYNTEKTEEYEIYYYEDKNNLSPIIENNNVIKENIFQRQNEFLYWIDKNNNKYFPNEIINLKENIKLYPFYKSLKPTNINYENNILTGNGIINSEIIIENTKSYIIKTTVNKENKWKIKIPYNEQSYFKIYQIENDMEKSDIVSFFV